MIVQLSISTANNVEVLARIPLADLFVLYDAVAFELDHANKKGAADAAP